MNDIEMLFRPDSSVFTVFVVEQRFVVGRGHEYFRSFHNSPNYFDSDKKIKYQFARIISGIEKSVAPVSKLISLISPISYVSNVSDVVTALCKLFTVHEHQAAGPDVIDPIILQEGKITKKALTSLIHLNKDSILCPSIIVLLKDNDFERAKNMLSGCPDGIHLKLIRNSGQEEIHKVINCGADDVATFITAFSEQCFNTCSRTKREILLNSNWSENPVISKYAPLLLKYRSNLLYDQKEEIQEELSILVNEIGQKKGGSEHDELLIRSFECTAKLFRVFCYDHGGQDILDAEQLARKLNNEVLLAQVYRYAELLPNCSDTRKEELYQSGYKIFKKNGMEDHAIYCMNNLLIHQFYSDKVYPEMFRQLQVEAVNNVPGMVGLSHIYNNVGIAYLFCGHSSTAVDMFTKGLDYARYQDRIVQNLALESNRMIAESYSFCNIDENRIRFLMRRIFDGMGIYKLPFLSADYVLNALGVAYKQNMQLGRDLINAYPVIELINASFAKNIMGSGERKLHLQFLAANYPDFRYLLDKCRIPRALSSPSGKKQEFIIRYGLNPFEFNTWL